MKFTQYIESLKMQEIVDVDTGRVAVRQGTYILRANAIGSCIAVAAYDAKTKTAGMAHIMLPDKAPAKETLKTKYAYDSIEHLLDLMVKAGSKVVDIEVCLIGAGNVLCKPDDTICQSNIESVTTILAAIRLPVRSSVLGGTERKNALLDARTGCVSYTQGDRPVALLWRPEERG